jgi:integrase/recombinase XerD
MLLSFDTFTKERLYLKNVTPKTVRWYWESWRAFQKHLPAGRTLETLTQDDLNTAVVGLRQAGVSPTSVNTYARAINAWLKWAGSKLKVPKQQKIQKTLPTFSPTQVARLVAWPARSKSQQRIKVLYCLILDTGLRASEALGLHTDDVDFDNLLIKVMGKGQKERLVPMSMELRKILWRWLQKQQGQYVFATRTGTHLSLRNAERDFAKVCKILGITNVRRLLHALRHTFALNYIRNGGNAFMLQRILGHTTLEMTRRYVNLQTADLQSRHNQL